MGVNAVLETRAGEVLSRVDDESGILAKVLPEGAFARYPLLGCVDRYGDTVFNGLQAVHVLAEITMLSNGLPQAEVAVLGAVRDLAVRCEAGPHLYLRFEGD